MVHSDNCCISYIDRNFAGRFAVAGHDRDVILRLIQSLYDHKYANKMCMQL